MGWYYGFHNRRADLIAELNKPFSSEQDGVKREAKVLASCYRGGMRSGVLYGVWENTITKADGTAETKRFIRVDLLKYSRDGWGHKPMDCCSGPYCHSCPESYLNMCPPHETSRHCADWHALVRSWHAAKKQDRAIKKQMQASR